MDKIKREVRIYGVPNKSVNELSNIAAHIGTPVSDLLKPKIAEFINSFPDHMRRPPIKE